MALDIKFGGASDDKERGGRLDAVLKHFSDSPLGKALIAADKPRAAIASGLNQLVGNPAEVSFREGFERHIGFGDIAPDTGNKWVDRGVGFVGDVVMDPLTWVSGGAKLAAAPATKAVTTSARHVDDIARPAFGQRAARLNRKQAALFLEKAGIDPKIVDDVMRGGVAAAPPEALEAAGIKYGTKFAGVIIPGTEGATRALARATTVPIKRHISKSTTAGIIRSKMGGKYGEEVTRLLQQFPDGGRKVLLATTAGTRASAQGQSFLNAGKQAVLELNDVVRKSGFDGPTLVRMAEEGSLDPSAVALREFFQARAKEFEALTGLTIPRLDNYIMHAMTREASELGDFANQWVQGLKATPRHQREIKDTIESINEWFMENHGDIKMFRDNPVEIANIYNNVLARELEKRIFVKNLGDLTGAERAGLKEVPSRAAREASAEIKKLEKAVEQGLRPNARLQQALDKLAEIKDATAGGQLSAAKKSIGEEGLAEAAAMQMKATLDLAEATRLRQVAAGIPANPWLENPPMVPRTLPKGDSAKIVALAKSADEFKQAIREVNIRAAATGTDPSDTIKALEANYAIVMREAEMIRRKMKGLDPVPPRLVQAALDRQAATLSSLTGRMDHAALTNSQQVAQDLSAEWAQEAAERAARFDQLTGQAKILEARAAETLREASSWAAEANRMFRQGDKELARIAMLEASAAAHSARLGGKLDDIEKLSRWVNDKELVADAKQAMLDGLQQLSDGRWAEPWVAETIARLDDLFKPDEMGKLLKTFDWLTTRWRAYALLSPGYHSRNFYGGVFNNWLWGLRVDYYAKYIKWSKMVRDANGDTSVLRGIVDAKTGISAEDAWKAMHRAAIGDDGNIGQLSDALNVTRTQGLSGDVLGAMGRGEGRGASIARKADPTSLDNVALSANTRAARSVERELRRPMFLDAYMRTGDADYALSVVSQYHFDYSDLSKFERKYVKRATGFYTWTRKNFPLQLEHMMTNPGKYTAYLHAKRNIEDGTPEDETVPKYYGELLAIRLPWTIKGNRMYLTPDLPSLAVNGMLEPNQMLSSLNPLFKTPAEAITQRSFFEDRPLSQTLREAPDTWAPILHVLYYANGKLGLPKVYKAADGTLMMNEHQAMKIESMIPLAGRLRRLAPSEQKYQDRWISSVLSILTGTGTRILDDAAIAGEMRRVQDDINAAKRRSEQLGGSSGSSLNIRFGK